jgi:hypothetical protein
MKRQTLFALVAVCVGCADDPYDPGAPVIDRSAPRVEIVSPARGTIAGDVSGEDVQAQFSVRRSLANLERGAAVRRSEG